MALETEGTICGQITERLLVVFEDYRESVRDY